MNDTQFAKDLAELPIASESVDQYVKKMKAIKILLGINAPLMEKKC